MQLRNRLLALFCLLVFIGFGILYFQKWVVQKPFGIILFIGDGMTAQNLTIARIFGQGVDKRLDIETFPHLALVGNYANDLAIPDSAAAATAIATGEKTNVRSLGLSPDGKPLRTIFELAAKAGRATGLVTTGSASDPAAAAFYAKAADPSDFLTIAAQLTPKSLPDVFLGGGEQDFLPVSKGGRRTDGRDMLLEYSDAGVQIIHTRADLESLGGFRNSKLLGLFSGGNLAFSDRIATGSHQPSLSDMVRRAVEFLQYNAGGYLLVVDAELITRAAEQNEGERAIRETLALDDAVATARRYAGDNALIIAVGKHATGGLTLNASPLRQDSGVAILGTNAFGVPSITWATGPKGPQNPGPPPNDVTEPAVFYTPTALNNATDVVAVANGPGSEAIRGFMDNTEIFQVLKKNL